MTRWIKTQWLVAILLFAGCTTDQAPNEILNKPPYAGVTDSIKRFPDNTELLLIRGNRLSQNNQHELAYQDYRRAWRRDSSEMAGMLFVSNLLMLNRPQEALELLESAVRKFPENPEFRRRLSEAYMANGKSDEALAQYDDLLRVDSSNFETWYEKGLLLMNMGDSAGAIDALARSYALQPLTMNGVALANLYAETRNPLALQIADELMRKDTLMESLDPIYIKGVYYSNTRQYAQALEQFEQCIRADWKFTDAYIEKGIILYEQKNIDEALQTFKLASTVSSANPDAYYWQGRCYEMAGKKEDAMDNYIRAYSLDKTFTQAKDAIERLRKQ
ncbi:MAG TPA: tetratricopeptide repeat protein [Chitinophagaceae bacterium]|nr:tetratricopeptide repeat protein [Chitinophagaceae bacterium]